MGRGRVWSGGSRRLAILLLAVVLPPAATLVWLGTQLLQQDRAALEQRELERRTAIGQAVGAHLRQSLRAAEGVLESSAIETGESQAIYRPRQNPSSFAIAPDGSAIFTSVQRTGGRNATATPSGRIVRSICRRVSRFGARAWYAN